MRTASAAPSSLRIRRAREEDAGTCGRICYEAFATINREHHFPPELPGVEMAQGLLAMMFTHPGFYCVVAEHEGRVVGSNCLDERAAIAGLGPITVDPDAQNGSIGRRLMEALLDRSRERHMAGVRLLQSAFHNRSLALYLKLGFEAREPMSVLHGPAILRPVDGLPVRPATDADLEACNGVCFAVHGYARSGELAEAIAHGTANVVERHGRITGYTSGFGYGGHSVGETNLDVQALIGSADTFEPPGFIVPTRNGMLIRWCLDHGLKIVQPMTLMSVGLYNEPSGAYTPSILA